MSSSAELPDLRARDWFREHTYTRSEDTDQVAELKQRDGARISVCLPALNEAGTVGAICSIVRDRLMASDGLVDELIVVDSGSSDGTADAATAAGATVIRNHPLLHELSPEDAGKGGALWSSLASSSGDIIVWLDADTQNFNEHFVTRLVTPLLRDPALKLVKAFYDRPLVAGGTVSEDGGGRVTELLVRPLLNFFYPQLSGVIQPLAGECAGRWEALSELSFVAGYGVEVAMLIDLVERWGLDALGQADLRVRIHRNRDLLGLGQMSFEILHTMLDRFEDLGLLKATERHRFLAQFEGSRPKLMEASGTVELPPVAEVLPRP